MVAEQRVHKDTIATQTKVECDLARAKAQHVIQSDNQDLREAQFAQKCLIDGGKLEMLRNKEDRQGVISPTG